MSKTPENIDEIKRKLRNLKKLEIKIRTRNMHAGSNHNEKTITGKLDWNEFFSAKGRYSIDAIASISKEEYKNIINEFFFNVYYKFYIENGFVNSSFYNPEILKWMGLPPDSGIEDIKKRFRELAKLYHPDTGGDGEKFIRLMENYKKLVE